MTTAREQLIQELERTPDFVIQEALDFLLFLKLRLQQRVQESPHEPVSSALELPPFLQFVEEISAKVPREDWEKLPKDLAQNLDHYLYGLPKEEP